MFVKKVTTREHIIETADHLIRAKGYNAFSFVDIAQVVGIRKPSIHHHFPRKTDLGIAVIDYHLTKLQEMQQSCCFETPVEKLNRFFAIYIDIKLNNKVCLVGSLATDFNTLDVEIQNKLKHFSEVMLNWVTNFLNDGRCDGVFHFNENPRTKAVLVISNMIAIVQLSRLTRDSDFHLIINSIKEQLLTK